MGVKAAMLKLWLDSVSDIFFFGRHHQNLQDFMDLTHCKGKTRNEYQNVVIKWVKWKC